MCPDSLTYASSAEKEEKYGPSSVVIPPMPSESSSILSSSLLIEVKETQNEEPIFPISPSSLSDLAMSSLSASSSSSATSSPSTAPSTPSTSTISESSTPEGETKESAAFKKELRALLAAKYRFSVKRSGSSLVIQCIAEHIPGSPGKVQENLDKLIRSFKSAIGSKNLKEGDHYEAKNKQVKAKSWELTVVAKSPLQEENSRMLDDIAELLEAAGYLKSPDDGSSPYPYFTARPSQVTATLFAVKPQPDETDPDDPEVVIGCRMQ